MMMYWKPDNKKTPLFSMLGRFSCPNLIVELRGIYLEHKPSPRVKILPFESSDGASAGRAPPTIPATWSWRGQPVDPRWSCRYAGRGCPKLGEPADWPGVCRRVAPCWALLSPSGWLEMSTGKCPGRGTACHLKLSSTAHKARGEFKMYFILLKQLTVSKSTPSRS